MPGSLPVHGFASVVMPIGIKPRCCSSRTTATLLAAHSNPRVGADPDSIHIYGGGYTEYIASTGHEAAGLRG